VGRRKKIEEMEYTEETDTEEGRKYEDIGRRGERRKGEESRRKMRKNFDMKMENKMKIFAFTFSPYCIFQKIA
jgi:hypothetical protein